MISGGNFKVSKSYTSENNELENNKQRKVDMKNMPACKLKLDNTVQEDRFKDLLTIAELKTALNHGSKFFVSNEKSNNKEYTYDINYTNLKNFHTFSFYVSMTIPKEFDRKDMKDSILIDPIYGIYEFTSKIDKQSKDCYNFVPEIVQKEKGKNGITIDNAYYHGLSWKLYIPKAGKLDFKNITD